MTNADREKVSHATAFAKRQAKKTLPRSLMAAWRRISELEQKVHELRLEKETLRMMLNRRDGAWSRGQRTDNE